MTVTRDQLKQARRQMKEWLALTGGRKAKPERAKKWRELVRDILQDAEIRKAATQRAKARRARQKQLAERFKVYR